MAITVPMAERQVTDAPMRGGQLDITPSNNNPANQTFAAVEVLGNQMLQHANQVFGLDADNQLTEATSIFRDDAMRKLGKDAIDTGDYKSNWDKRVDKLRQTATNDNQRFMVDKLAQGHWAVLDHTIKTHAIEQFAKYDMETTNASNNNAIRSVADNYNNIPAIQNIVNLQYNHIAAYGGRNGKSPEWIQDRTAAFGHTAIEGAIKEAVVNGNDTQALKIYDENQKYLLGNKTDIEALLHTASTMGMADRLSQQAFNEIYGETDGKTELNRYDGEVALRELTNDPNIIKTGITMLTESVNGYNAKIKAIEDANENSATDAVLKGKSLSQIRTMQAFTDMKPKARMAFIDKMTERGKKISTEEDPAVVRDLSTKAMKFPTTATSGEIFAFKMEVADNVERGIINPTTGRTINSDAENAAKSDPATKAGITAVIQSLSNDHKNGLMGDGAAGNAVFNKVVEGLRQWVQKHPDEPPSVFYDAMSTPYKETWVQEMLGSWSSGTPDYPRRLGELNLKQTPAAAPTSQTAPQAPQEKKASQPPIPQGKVRVMNPQGQSGLIPADKLKAAIKAGYKEVR